MGYGWIYLLSARRGIQLSIVQVDDKSDNRVEDGVMGRRFIP